LTAECNQDVFLFHPLNQHEIRGQFDGGCFSSDGGSVLLWEVEKRPASPVCRLLWRFSEAATGGTPGGGVGGAAGVWTGTGATKTSMTMTSYGAIRCWRSWWTRTMPEGKSGGGPRIRAWRWQARARCTGWNWTRSKKASASATRKSFRRRGRRSVVGQHFSASPPVRPGRDRSGWTAPIFRCMGSKKIAFSTATTGSTAICCCTSFAASLCCVRACDRRISMGRKARGGTEADCGPDPAEVAAGADQRAWGFGFLPRGSPELVRAHAVDYVVGLAQWWAWCKMPVCCCRSRASGPRRRGSISRAGKRRECLPSSATGRARVGRGIAG